MRRVVILGNSGSGKTTLARALASAHGLDLVELDRLFWEPGGFNQKRPPDVVHAEIGAKKATDGWVVEGVFGELAERFLDRADTLVWLDLPWDVCRAGLLARGSESSRQLDPVTAEANFRRLLAWAGDYERRTDMRSRAGHQKLFDAFTGLKYRFTDRSEAEAFARAG